MITLWLFYRKQTGTKRPCHNWWCLRLPLSCLSGLILGAWALVWGAQAGSNAGLGTCRAGSWLMGKESSTAKKPCPCREKEWPYFCSIFLQKPSVMLQHVKPKQTQFSAHRVIGSQQGWGWLVPLEMALSSPLHRARSAPAACMGLCPVVFWIFPSTEFHSLSEQAFIGLFYLQSLSAFALQKHQKAPFSGFCRQCCLSAPL